MISSHEHFTRNLGRWCDRSMLWNLPRVVWLLFLRPDRCSRYSSYKFHIHSCLHSVLPTDIEGRRRRWWSSAPHVSSRSSSEGYSCSAWRHHRDGSDRLNRERERNTKRENKNSLVFAGLWSASYLIRSIWLVLQYFMLIFDSIHNTKASPHHLVPFQHDEHLCARKWEKKRMSTLVKREVFICSVIESKLLHLIVNKNAWHVGDTDWRIKQKEEENMTKWLWFTWKICSILTEWLRGGEAISYEDNDNWLQRLRDDWRQSPRCRKREH